MRLNSITSRTRRVPIDSGSGTALQHSARTPLTVGKEETEIQIKQQVDVGVTIRAEIRRLRKHSGITHPMEREWLSLITGRKVELRGEETEIY